MAEDHGLAEVKSASPRRNDVDADSHSTPPHQLQQNEIACLSRKQKRQILKKAKRKQFRRKLAEEARIEEEKFLQDPARLQQEAEALEKERLEHEFQERLWLERERKAQEDAEKKRREDEESKKAEEDEWEYVDDDGPAEIIWEGNEIIVRKKKIKVRKREHEAIEDDRPVSNPLAPAKDYDRPVSNPLPPQETAFEEQKISSRTNLLASMEQTPNFGTEQDKTHCPFHIKTGVCRFGVNCSRVHVYPDKSCTLLIKNMYNGPGLPLDHDEGLEYTDEEIAQYYEEFYGDVHGEFQKYGELVNFKVCKNESSHLRGNVYIQFQSVDSAIAAYNAMNGRFYAGKQITCEFVTVTRWRVALCGEYMRSHHRTCSHGTACNFLHCFRNPHDEYGWADWDNSAKPTFNVHRKKRDLEDTDHRFNDHPHRVYRDRHRSGGGEKRSEFSHDHASGKRRDGRDLSETDSHDDSMLRGYEDSRRRRQRSHDRRERLYQDACGDDIKKSLVEKYEVKEERGHKIRERRRARSHFSKERSTERGYVRRQERRHHSRERLAERDRTCDVDDRGRHANEKRKRRHRSHMDEDGFSMHWKAKESVRQWESQHQEGDSDGCDKSSGTSDEMFLSRKTCRKRERQEDKHDRRHGATGNRKRKHRKQEEELHEKVCDVDDRYQPRSRSSSYEPID